jgi:hypothetical protein
LSKKVSVVTAEMTDVRSKTHLQRDMMRSKTDKSKMCIPKHTLSFFFSVPQTRQLDKKVGYKNIIAYSSTMRWYKWYKKAYDYDVYQQPQHGL